MEVAAVLLAGGRGSRLGGVDKGALRLDGSTLVERALDALQGVPTVVVGDRGAWADARQDVLVVREEPPLSGPAAAVLTGLAALPAADEVLLLAVDVVGLPAAVPVLLAAERGPAGVVAVDRDGRDQWLLGRYDGAALRAAAQHLGDPAGASLRSLLAGLDLARLPLPASLTGDVDTLADARAAGVGLPEPWEEHR